MSAYSLYSKPKLCGAAHLFGVTRQITGLYNRVTGYVINVYSQVLRSTVLEVFLQQNHPTSVDGVCCVEPFIRKVSNANVGTFY